jgi:hypothetical protein
VTASATVQAEVEHLGTALAQSVLIEDARHQPLWWSVQGTVDGTRLRTILRRECGPAAIAVVAKLGLAKATGPVRTPAAPEAEMLERWCVPLRAGHDLLGYMWVLDADDEVGEDRLPELLACAEIAQAFLAHNRPTPEGHQRARLDLLDRLAAGPDAEAVRELVALERMRADVTVAVDCPATVDEWTVGRSSGVPVSVRLDPPSGSPATSGPALPLADLHVAVHRARVTQRALSAGAVLADPSWESLGVWRLIAAASDDLAVADVHPGADALARLSRPDLMDTARRVLELGGDVAAAAADLHIHRTTLYYRIERIESLTGVNLKTGPRRTDLQMALRLAAYRSVGQRAD